jgi:hypothetical protein
MQIKISDYQKIILGQKDPHAAVRFQVAVWSDDHRFLFSSNGWTIDRYRNILPPRSRMQFGHATVSTGNVSEEFKERLRGFLETVPDVVSILGPRVKRYAEIRKEKAAARRISGPELTVFDGREG